MTIRTQFLRAATAGITAAVLAASGVADVARADGTPTVRDADSGVRGGHYMSSVADLDAAGYVEREVFLSGVAQRYDGLDNAGLFPSPTGSDADQAPFTTRLIVRQPAEASDFNGIAVVEWFNVTPQVEIDLDWGVAHRLLMAEGYAYIGVSAQETGVRQLRAWDPVRYGALEHPGDAFAYDIFAQAAEVLRAGDLVAFDGAAAAPTHVLASGHSQSGMALHDIVEHVEGDVAHIADGYLIRGDDERTFEFGDPTRSAPAVPVLHYMSESEAVGIASSTSRIAPPNAGPFRPDGANYRLWHIAGAAHNDHWSNMIWLRGQAARDWSGLPVPWDEQRYGQYGAEPTGDGVCREDGSRINEFPQRHTLDAAFARLTDWVVDGTAPDPQPRFEFSADGDLVRDPVTGNVASGIQHPVLSVPVATYTGETGCPLSGATKPFDDAELAQRYATNDDYVAQLEAAAAPLVSSGMLLPMDLDDLVARARVAPVPRPLLPVG